MTENDLVQLAHVFVRGFPQMDQNEQTLARAVYTALSRGKPLVPRLLCEPTGLDLTYIVDTLSAWPTVFWDHDERIVAFLGLTVEPTRHQFVLNGGGAYTWCAWDSLFIPGIIGYSARVRSTCPATDVCIELDVDPEKGITSISPPTAVMSFLTPTESQLGETVTANFCQYVHFLASAESAESWLAERPELFVLSLDEAFRLGQLVNVARFTDVAKI